MVKKCPNCGTTVVEGTKFCGTCGSEIVKKTKKSTQPASVTPPPPAQTFEQPTQAPLAYLAPKKSKKILIAIITVIVVAAVIGVALFFVFQSPSYSIVGKWNVTFYPSGPTDSGTQYIWTVYGNGSVKAEYPSGALFMWGTYTINDGQICGVWENAPTLNACFDYRFTNGGNTCTLSLMGITAVTMTRLS